MDFFRVLSQIGRPWAYLRVSAHGKAVFDWLVPSILALAIVSLLCAAGDSVSMFGEGGVFRQLTSFVQGLPGFFIAALAAVATFNRDDLDKLLPAPTPTMVVLNRGQAIPLELTRRRFLCSLFAFLTAQSLLITCVGIFSSSLALWVVEVIPSGLYAVVRAVGGYLFLLLLCQLLSVTCLGLYYLGDRLHLPDQ